MKNIYFGAVLLSGLLLLSCSKSEPEQDSSKPGIPAKLEIRLSGNTTRAVVPDPTEESAIGKGMVFVFRGTGINPVIDGKASFDFTSSALAPITVNITAGSSRHIYVVANIANEADFNGVTKITDLYNLATKYQLTAMRTGKNLGMTGFVSNVDASNATTSSPVTATVQLNFLGSQVHIDWDASEMETANPGFSITKAYLLNVKSQCDYFSYPGYYLTGNVNSYLRGKDVLTGFSGSYLPSAPATNTYDVNLLMGNLLNDKGFANNSFYIMENNSPAPTMVVLEGTHNAATYYYPIVINGDQNGSGASNATNAGNKSLTVTRGNIYNVKAIIKGFGNNDPYEPLSKGAINVTILPAAWNPVLRIDQEFI